MGGWGKRALVLLLPAAVIFVLGWLLGRQSGPPRATAPSAVAPSAIELKLDASAVTLLPDAGLYLRPLEPVASPDASAASR